MFIPLSRIAWRKPITFGLVSALGCLLAAGAGELWLGVTKPPPPPPPKPPPPPPQQAVVLVLDTSWSMNDGSLDEMKQAATAYVERQDFQLIRVAVVNFDDQSHLVAALTRDKQILISAINGLQTNGLTRMDLGLQQALGQLQGEQVQRNILLFTDGMPEGGFFFDAETPTLEAAEQVRRSGARLLAIASGSSDRNFLVRLTGDPNLVFSASQGNFGEAFKQAEQIITPPPKTAQLIESAPAENTDFRSSLWRIGIWTGILGLGLSLPLLLAQKRYMRRPLGLEDTVGTAGGVLIGLLAGVLAQSFFAISDESGAVVGGRLLAWAIWGGALGWGLSAFVPNLRADRAAPAGAVGGLLGAFSFLAVASALGDVAARWVGAAVLGFCIGAMIVWAEVAFRRAWLRISYGPGDSYDLNLGVRPLGVGSDPTQCRVIAPQADPVAARYALTEMGRVYIEEPQANRRFDIPIGDERRFGNVTVTVCGELADTTDSAAAQSQPPLVPPLSPTMPQHSTSSASLSTSVTGWQLWNPQVSFQVGVYGSWSVGRASDNDLVLSDGTVSSHHARIEVQNGVLWVIDIGSTNGTFVNGLRMQSHSPVAVGVGDRLKLGQAEFIVQQI